MFLCVAGRECKRNEQNSFFLHCVTFETVSAQRKLITSQVHAIISTNEPAGAASLAGAWRVICGGVAASVSVCCVNNMMNLVAGSLPWVHATAAAGACWALAPGHCCHSGNLRLPSSLCRLICCVAAQRGSCQTPVLHQRQRLAGVTACRLSTSAAAAAATVVACSDAVEPAPSAAVQVHAQPCWRRWR